MTSVFIHPGRRSIHLIQSESPLVAPRCYIRVWYVISTLRIWDAPFSQTCTFTIGWGSGWSCNPLWKDLEHRWKFRCSCQRFLSRNDNWSGAIFYKLIFQTIMQPTVFCFLLTLACALGRQGQTCCSSCTSIVGMSECQLIGNRWVAEIYDVITLFIIQTQWYGRKHFQIVKKSLFRLRALCSGGQRMQGCKRGVCASYQVSWKGWGQRWVGGSGNFKETH